MLLHDQLAFDEEKSVEKVRAEYKKLRNKYHKYWWGKDFRLVPTSECIYCGEHNYIDHRKHKDGSVSQFAGSCNKMSKSYAMLTLISYNFKWGEYTREKVIDNVRNDETTMTEWWKGGSKFEYDWEKEELGLIYDNLLKAGYFTNDTRPKLTELGVERLCRLWMGSTQRQLDYDKEYITEYLENP